MKVVGIIQARMGSSRLPGKVLRGLGNQTVLAHVIDRVRQIVGIDGTVVATTVDPIDDAIAAEAVRHGAIVSRGSESDVLERYFQAATAVKADVVIRITSDCPLLDPVVVSDMLARFVGEQGSEAAPDYMSNGLRRTFPRGLDAEIMRMNALAQAYREAKRPYEREHVTPYIYQHPDRFRIESYEGSEDLSAHRWTLDTELDYRMLSTVFEGLRPLHSPSTVEVLAYLKAHPEVMRINAEVRQKSLGQ